MLAKSLKCIVLIAWLVLGASYTHAAPIDELKKLSWKNTPSTLHLSGSNLNLPKGFVHISGNDVQKAFFITQGKQNNSVESYIIGPNDSEFWLGYTSSGYVDASDWSDIDPDAMMAGFKEITSKGNAERISNGASPMEVIGWRQKPIIDRASQTVHFAVDVNTPDGVTINHTVYRLGRYGFESIKLVVSEDDYTDNKKYLDMVLASHSFASGQTHADYVSGDRVAQFGVAGLVGAAAGVKFAKAGFMVFIIAIAKKVGFYLLALPFIFLFGLIGALFKKKDGIR